MAHNGMIVLTLLAVLFVWVYAFFVKCDGKQMYANTYASVGKDYINVTGRKDDGYKKGDYDQNYAAIEFANLFGGKDYSTTVPVSDASNARFAALHESTKIPVNASYSSTYDADIADPKYYTFSSRQPQVILKDPLYLQADPMRGDIPITKHNDICLIEKSEHGRESLRYSGLFNPLYDDMISEYTHRAEGQRSMPVVVKREGTIMDATSAPSKKVVVVPEPIAA